MKKFERIALDICHNSFIELDYSVETNLLTGYLKGGHNLTDEKVLGQIYFHEFCQLLLVLSHYHWKPAETIKEGYVILTK